MALIHYQKHLINWKFFKHNSFGLRMDVIIPTVIPLMFCPKLLYKPMDVLKKLRLIPSRP